MAKGRKTGGRQKGVRNRATEAVRADVIATGITPLDFLLGIMRDEKSDKELRLEAGKAAAPYVHPKLANIELTGKDQGPLQVNIVRFSDRATEPLGTARLPVQGVGGAGTGRQAHGAVLAPKVR